MALRYPIKMSKTTRILLRLPEKKGEYFFSLPVINILNRHLSLSCIISEDAGIPYDDLKCNEMFIYKKRITFLSKEYFRLKGIIRGKKFNIFVDMSDIPMSIISKITNPDISISYKDAKRFNIQIRHSEDIDYLSKYLLIPNLMGINDKRIVWGIRNKIKYSGKDKKSIGYHFIRERLNKKMKGIDAIKVTNVKELSSLSLFITDMNNLLFYAYISNIPILYVRTADTLRLPEREGVKTLAEEDFRSYLQSFLSERQN